MLTYTYADARQNFMAILNTAKEVREVLIQGDDGASFILKLLPQRKINYNLPALNLDLSREEIVDFVREIRTRNAR
jgi:hypothetical protein